VVIEHASLRHAVRATIKLLKEAAILFDFEGSEWRERHDELLKEAEHWLARHEESGLVFDFDDWRLRINDLWDSDTKGISSPCVREDLRGRRACSCSVVVLPKSA